VNNGKRRSSLAVEEPGFKPGEMGRHQKWLQPRGAGAKAIFGLHSLGPAKAVPFHRFLRTFFCSYL
jgi:hypothetical protein